VGAGFVARQFDRRLAQTVHEAQVTTEGQDDTQHSDDITLDSELPVEGRRADRDSDCLGHGKRVLHAANQHGFGE